MSLPLDFCPRVYRSLYKDLSNLDEDQATLHYLLNGHKEYRSYKKQSQKHVTVSIVTYKNEELLEECLDSIEKKTKYKNYTVVVTDNGAEERVESLVQRIKNKKILDLIYIKNSKNEYFSKPHNKVIERFKSSDIILLNDDTTIETSCWIEELQKSAYISSEIACCGGKAIMPDGKLEEAGSILLNNGYGIYIGRDDDPNKEFYKKRRPVGYCSGSLLYMRRDAIQKIGMLDEDLKPLYYEDTDWQYRAHLAGLEVIYEPKCLYIHKGRATTRNKLNEYANSAREVFMNKFKNHDLEAFNDMSEEEAKSLLK